MKFIPYGALGLSSVLILTACGGDSSSPAAPPVVAVETPSTVLAGSVAVGAPITDGTLRVLDATGTVVAVNVGVNADGTYSIPKLEGTAPFRIEACGYAAANYLCIYSVAQGPGKANVTPLTTATVLLASGQSLATLMTSAGNTTLTPAAVNSAQSSLRTGLASVLAAGNVASDFDFVSGDLSAGTRAGYDKVLDAIGVSTGVDQDKPFVQITPRLGTGNLYLEKGVSEGTVQSAPNADKLSLGGLETLFHGMSDALASADACGKANTGLASHLATDAHISGDDGEIVNGKANVAQGLCGMFAQEDRFGSKLLSPTLGRCDLSGNVPVCRVSFVIQGSDGSVESVGQGLGVTQEGGKWKFVGDVDTVQVHASAKAQRDQRVDGGTPLYTYSRAIAFDIPAVSGLLCAKVSQKDRQQNDVPIAYYKPYSTDARRLSLWQVDRFQNSRSLTPTSGALRSSDDTWVALPEGTDGDELVRNFFRGGRNVTVSMYGDDACTTPFAIGGQTKTSFEVEVEGVPPVWAAMAELPWPELTTESRTTLLGLSLAADANAPLTVGWTFPHGPLGVNGATFCSDRALCGDSGAGRLGDKRVGGGATSVTMNLRNHGTALEANSYKMIALYGRTGDGLDLQSNAMACPSGTVECH